MARLIKIENLRNHVTRDMEEKHFSIFSKKASHVGNGIYSISGLYSSDTRELFLMYCAMMEGIKFENE